MFAVWLMFGVLGIPIREEFGLTDVQLAWLTAVAVLNGAIWRLPAGIAADRFGGKRVFVFMLAVTAIPAYLVSQAQSYAWLLVCAFLVGFAGNSFSVGIAWVSAWWPQSRQGFALGVFGAGNVGASLTKFIGPALIAAVPAAGFLGGFVPGGWRFVPFLYMVLLIAVAIGMWLWTPHRDIKPSQGRTHRVHAQPAQAHAGLALQPLLRRRVRRLRRARGLAAEVLRRRLRARAEQRRPADGAVHLPGLAAAAVRWLALGPARRSPGHVLHVPGDAHLVRHPDDAVRLHRPEQP